MKSVGIDIGSASIKLAEIEYSNRKYVLTRFEHHPLDLTPGTDPLLDVIEKLRELLAPYPAETTRFVLGLDQSHLTVRYRSFPFKERQKIYKSLPFELEDETPFTIDDSIFESKIVRYHALGADVLAFACPRKFIEEALDFCKDINIPLQVLSTSGVALSNLTDRWWEAPPISAKSLQPIAADEEEEDEDDDTESTDEEVALEVQPSGMKVVVHIGHQQTILTAQDEKGTIAMSSIDWGASQVIDAIAQKYSIPFHEAAKEFQEKAFWLLNHDEATPDQIAFSEMVETSMKDLARPLRLTLLQWQSEFKMPVQELLLSGGGSHIQNLGAFFTTQFEIATNRFDMLQNLQQVEATIDSNMESMAGVAVGLALEGHRRPRNPAVNFLKDDFAVKSYAFEKLWQKWGLAIQVAAILFVVFSIYSIAKDSIAQGLADAAHQSMVQRGKSLTQQRRVNTAKIKKAIRQEKKISKAKARLKEIVKMNSAVDILKSLSDSIPDKSLAKVDIKKLTINHRNFMIEGYTETEKQSQNLAESLSRMAFKGQVSQQKSNLPKTAGKFAFSYTFQVDRGIRKAKK